MTDPIKRSDKVYPSNVLGKSGVDPQDPPVIRNRRTYPWAWIIGIIIVLLIIWAFFGWNHRTTRDVNPAVQPATAASTAVR